MNAQWQQVHHGLNQETEHLRQRTAATEHLQSEVAQLRNYQNQCQELGQRLREVEAYSEELRAQAETLRGEKAGDQSTIQRLQATIESIQENTDSEAGHLEAELLQRHREGVSLRLELEEARKRIDELFRERVEAKEDMDSGRQLKGEVARLEADLESTRKEKEALDDVVKRCLDKLQKIGLEQPYQVDKRMVTQMIAAFLEQRDNPRNQNEVMAKMADLLGFTSAERAQVGLKDKRKGLSLEPEPASFEELTAQFVDFLHEEVEQGA